MKCSVDFCNNETYSRNMKFCKRHIDQMNNSGKILDRTMYDPNEFIIEGNICRIRIFSRSGELKCEAIIDFEDLDKIKNFKWYSDGPYNIIRTNNRTNGLQTSLLSRLIMNLHDKSLVVDHINGDRLDNRKSNLRVCSVQQNTRNRLMMNTNTSGMKGVYNSGGKWCAQIEINRKTYYLGSFSSKEEAAEAYDKAAIEKYGDFAKTNKTLRRMI